MKYFLLLGAALVSLCAAQQQKYTTPVPILKQINKHNEDGSYSYGYEGADGSFKIETKYPNGEVYGKYGYVDDSGKVREVEYGASRRGFEPAGNDINVAPPTIPQKQDTQIAPLGPNDEDDGQYREDPSVYYQSEPNQQPVSRYQSVQQPASRYQQPAYQQPAYQQPAQRQPVYQEPAYEQPSYQQPKYQQPKYQQPSYQAPQYEEPQQAFNAGRQTYKPAPSYNPPAPRYNPPAPSYNPTPSYNNYNSGPNYAGHPAKNIDIGSGSYTVQY